MQLLHFSENSEALRFLSTTVSKGLAGTVNFLLGYFVCRFCWFLDFDQFIGDWPLEGELTLPLKLRRFGFV